MQKDDMIRKLKEKHFRITKQRKIILDIILEEECDSCKEIYYKASKVDPTIGMATVYRMMNALEEIGAISRRNMYRVEEERQQPKEEETVCCIRLDNGQVLNLSAKTLQHIVVTGLKKCAYITDQEIQSLDIKYE